MELHTKNNPFNEDTFGKTLLAISKSSSTNLNYNKGRSTESKFIKENSFSNGSYIKSYSTDEDHSNLTRYSCLGKRKSSFFDNTAAKRRALWYCKSSSSKPSCRQKCINQEVISLYKTECKLSLAQKIQCLKTIWNRDREHFNEVIFTSFINTITKLYKESHTTKFKCELSSLAQKTINDITPLIHFFKSQALTLISFGFASLGIRSDELFEKIAKRSVNIIKYFNPQALTNITWAFAVLNYRNESAFLEAITEQTIKTIDAFDTRHITNMAWAFATLDINNTKSLLLLSKYIRKYLDSLTQDKTVEQAVLFCEYYLMKLEGSQESNSLLDSLKSTKQALLNKYPTVKTDECPSYLQTRVQNSLQEIEGFSFEIEVPLFAQNSKCMLTSVDFLDESNKVAIEVNGPTHYTQNKKQILLGRNNIKDALLTMLGYRVIHIPYFDWDYLKDDIEKTNYLNELLNP